MNSKNLVRSPSSQSIILASYFHGPARPQNFVLPDTIIYHITKNPSSAKVYQKLVKTCKHFFINNPVIVLPCLHYTKKGWRICSEKCALKKDKSFDTDAISTKIWVTDTLDLFKDKVCAPSSYISKIYRCDVDKCYLFQQNISLNQLIFLASSARYLTLKDCFITDSSGSFVYVETIISKIPMIVDIRTEFSSNVSYDSANTVQKLLEIPHFSKMRHFRLTQISDSFDIERLFEYIKKTADFLLALEFSPSISDEYRNRLEAIVDKLLATESTTFRFPYFFIPPFGRYKCNSLLHRFLKSK